MSDETFLASGYGTLQEVGQLWIKFFKTIFFPLPVEGGLETYVGDRVTKVLMNFMPSGEDEDNSSH
jgi:hypothetical protein